MSSGEIRKVSRQDIQLVQNLIERCLQLYMNQKEVVDTLLYQAKIEPGFTELVWQKLEEENRDFFRAYHVRLMLKNQILVFNKLLEKQVELMRKTCPPGVGSVPISNGSCSSTLNQNPSCFLSENASTSSRPTCLLSNGASSSHAIINGGHAGSQNVKIGSDASTLTGRMDVPVSVLPSTNSHFGRGDQGTNGTAIKSEPNYTSNSEFAFTGLSFLETQPTIGDTVGASFPGAEQALNEPLQDIDTSPYGFLSHIPRSFSFTDLTDGFAHSSDILESYGRSPYLAPHANDFTGSPGVECNDEERRLDTISEGVSYEDFGSD
ncbi:hypothetical protein AXF42_Ash001535 [Apostasia shenzhenica]|uniref:Angiotensin-converting enzyme 2 n=1 Tax=Apostasia shenzhenica TaxID=1088818 RepID=A0A2I0AAM1_9ASPA|nr:hypothetical protein AXF42_Ash001535 [Apostasia shenzhenica]